MSSVATRADGPGIPSIWYSLPYYLPVAIYPLIYLAAVQGGWWLAGPIIYFGTVNPLEVFFGEDLRNLDPKRAPVQRLIRYNLPLWLCALLWPLTFIFALWQILVVGHLAVWEIVLLVAILTGQGSGILVVGHEMVHRRRSWEQYVGEFLFTSVSYPHYPLDHLYIHHPYVGTPKDTSSAPKGQSFFTYFPREVIGNFFGSWEAVRKLMEGRQMPMWHYSNPYWRYGIETAAWYVFIFLLGGWWAVLVFIFCCLAVLFMMKIINYVQHYGLRRIRLPNGRFERVAARHTWGVDYKYNNWMFFNMQRHADHHLRAGRNYPLLQHFGDEECPMLPGSYNSLSGLVLLPKRWFEKMDPLVDQWRARFYPEIEDWSAYDSQVSIARPDAFEAIVEIFGAAPRLARAIESNPGLLDTLQDKEFTDLEIPEGCWPDDPEFEKTARQGLVRVYWTYEFGVDEMKEQISEISVRNATDAVNMLRTWSNNKVFQVGIHTLRGNLAPKEAGIALANVAEASIDAVLRATVEDVADSGQLPEEEGVAVVILGDLASREVAPRATLEVLFVYQGNPAGCQTLCRRFHDALRALTRTNLLFEPYSKRDRASIYSVDDLVKKYRSASAGELLTLTRARCLFAGGATRTEQRFDEERRNLLTQGPAKDALVQELRKTIEGGSKQPERTLAAEIDRGLRKIECAARLLQVRHLEKMPGSLNGASATQVFQSAAELNLIPGEVAGQLTDSALMWRNLHGVRQLVMEDDADIESMPEKVRMSIAQYGKQTEFEQLLASVRETAVACESALADILDMEADVRSVGSK